jgi:DNA-binding PadR family transcriptional regulator
MAARLYWNGTSFVLVQGVDAVGKSDVPARNQLSVLDLLAETDREMAGIDVANAIGGLGRSSTYAALAALQRDKLVTARWEVEGPRPRRMYRITSTGREALARARSQVRAYGARLAPQGMTS